MMTHTKVPIKLSVSKLEPEVEFCRQGAFFSNFVLGHISAADQAIFTKYGVYVDNGSPKTNMADGGPVQ